MLSDPDYYEMMREYYDLIRVEESRDEAAHESKLAESRQLARRALLASFKEIPGDSWTEKLEHLNKCECCDRHQYERPRLLAPWDEETMKDIPWTWRGCKCSCRHSARMICRQMVYDEGGHLLCPPCPGESEMISEDAV